MRNTHCNLILAGVGGQGILTIAQILSDTALRQGLHVKQAETHGMSQRGGAVQSHLRISERPMHSDLVCKGECDVILAVEPLEAIRYIPYLKPDGVIVTSSLPFVNIPDYPAVEDVLKRIARYARHVLLNAERLAKEAGIGRASNIVMLGAAVPFLPVSEEDLEQTIGRAFASKGDTIVAANQRALHLGTQAAGAFLAAIDSGASSQATRQWLETVEPQHLGAVHVPEASILSLHETIDELSAAEEAAITRTIHKISEQRRDRLYEHEVYSLLALVGAISPPRHMLVSQGNVITADQLADFPGEKVVLKLVSHEVIHKTEAGGVVFVNKNADTVKRELHRLTQAQTDRGVDIEGVLVVEYIEHAKVGFGNELFVGLRSTREFGPVIAAGLGGIDTEYLASKMRAGLAVAKALALDTSAESFLALFKRTTAYEILAGLVRGHQRVVSDGELLRCFRAFLAIAKRFLVYRGDTDPGIIELEVNPFAFTDGRMIPLDGRGRLGRPTPPVTIRPLEKVERLLEPRSIAVMGVSSKRHNFGRIILNNIRDSGFPSQHLYVIKDQADPVDGVQCVRNISAASEAIDLVVTATGADTVPGVVDQCIQHKCISSVILIPGGLGETQGTQAVQQHLRRAIDETRTREDRGPVFLGGNSLGIRSRPGRYDTFFIHSERLDPRRHVPAKRVALISQSGAFMITRMSNLKYLDPAFAISVGNQIDLTIADLLQVVGRRDDIDCIGVYVEGFRDLDGLSFVRAVRELADAGKVVIFYKAGRTGQGRTATQGHTASIAGDYDVCQTAAANAGAIVVDTFKEFEQLLELATDLHHKKVLGRRIGVISNAGYETVGMADTLRGTRYRVEIPAFSELDRQRLADILKHRGLEALINIRNPLDLTPMADDKVYQQCIEVMVDSDDIDAVVVSAVPMTTQLLAMPEQVDLADSLASRLPTIVANAEKPVVFIVDSGHPFEALVEKVRSANIPVFKSCDQAIRSLGRYLCHRSREVESDEQRAAVDPQELMETKIAY